MTAAKLTQAEQAEQRCQALRERGDRFKSERNQARDQLMRVSDDKSGGRYCGCYVLVLGGAAQYVGQSVNVFARIAAHRGKGEWPTHGKFDEVRIVWCEAAERNEVERRLIEELRPLHNRAGVVTPYYRRNCQHDRTPAAMFGEGFSSTHVGAQQ